MSKTKFIHLRRRTANGPLPRGGLTFAYVVKDETLLVASARCSDKDNFNRARGRQIAGGRLEKGKDLDAIIFLPHEARSHAEAILETVRHDGYMPDPKLARAMV